MADTIETLTDEERKALEWPMPHRAEAKALRIIDAQGKRIAELEGSVRHLNVKIEAVRTNLTDRLQTAETRGAELQRQLPEGMQSCTIRFIECPVGHGRLTAANWIEHGCLHCRIAELEGELAQVLETLRHEKAEVLRLTEELAGWIE